MKIKYIRRKYRKFIRITLRTFYWVVFAALLVAGVTVILSTFNTPLSHKLLTVQSGSMEPKIHMGSLVVVKPNTDYRVGDIITFHTKDPKIGTLTHRIAEVKYLPDGTIRFVTKGDANEDRDSEPVNPDQVVGKTIFSIPLLGFLITFIRKPTGAIILIVIPATLFVSGEISKIKREIISIRRRKAFA